MLTYKDNGSYHNCDQITNNVALIDGLLSFKSVMSELVQEAFPAEGLAEGFSDRVYWSEILRTCPRSDMGYEE